MSPGTPDQIATKPPLRRPRTPSAIIVAAKNAWPKPAMWIALTPGPVGLVGNGIARLYITRARTARCGCLVTPPGLVDGVGGSEGGGALG
jgi:hypothetical protein